MNGAGSLNWGGSPTPTRYQTTPVPELAAENFFGTDTGWYRNTTDLRHATDLRHIIIYGRNPQPLHLKLCT